MSSHHIIREKQEPALLILDIASFDEEHFGQLLEWSPTVIVSDEVYDHVLSLGIKIDVLVKQSSSNLETQEHVKVCTIANQDIINSAMDYLIKEEYPSVNIIVKHFNVDDFSPYVNQLDIVVFANNTKIFPIKSGFSKWKPAGDKVLVITDDVDFTSVEGLKLSSKQECQTVNDGFYRLNFTNNFIFIGEEL